MSESQQGTGSRNSDGLSFEDLDIMIAPSPLPRNKDNVGNNSPSPAPRTVLGDLKIKIHKASSKNEHEKPPLRRRRPHSQTITTEREFSDLCAPDLVPLERKRDSSSSSSSSVQPEIRKPLTAWQSVDELGDNSPCPRCHPNVIKEEPIHKPLTPWKSCSDLQRYKDDCGSPAGNISVEERVSTADRRKSVSFELPNVHQVMTYPPEESPSKASTAKTKGFGGVNKALKKSLSKGFGKLTLPRNLTGKDKQNSPSKLKSQNSSPLPYFAKNKVKAEKTLPEHGVCKNVSASPLPFLRKKIMDGEPTSSIKSSGSNFSEQLNTLKRTLQMRRSNGPSEPKLTGFVPGHEFPKTPAVIPEGDNVSINSLTSIESSASNIKSKLKKSKWTGKRYYDMIDSNPKELKLHSPPKVKSQSPVKAIKSILGKHSKSTLDLSELEKVNASGLSRSYDDILKENNYPTQEEFMIDIKMLTLSFDDIEHGDFDDDDDYYRNFLNRRRTLSAEQDAHGLTLNTQTFGKSSPSVISKSDLSLEKCVSCPIKGDISRVSDLAESKDDLNVSPTCRRNLYKRGSVHDIVQKYESLEPSKPPTLSLGCPNKPPLPPKPLKLTKSLSTNTNPESKGSSGIGNKDRYSAEDSSFFKRDFAFLDTGEFANWKVATPWVKDQIKKKGKQPVPTPRSSVPVSSDTENVDLISHEKEKKNQNNEVEHNIVPEMESHQQDHNKELNIPHVIVTSEPDELSEAPLEKNENVDGEQMDKLSTNSQNNIIENNSNDGQDEDVNGHHSAEKTLSASSNEEQGFFTSLHRLVMKNPSLSSNEDQPTLKQRLVKKLSSVSSSEEKDTIELIKGKLSPRPSEKKKKPPKRPPPPKIPLEKVNSYNCQYLKPDNVPVPETPPPPKPPRLFQILTGHRKSEVSPNMDNHNFRRFSLVDSDLEVICSEGNNKENADEVNNQDSVTDADSGDETYTKYPLGEPTDDEESLPDMSAENGRDDDLEIPPESPQPVDSDDQPIQENDDVEDVYPEDERKYPKEIISPFPVFNPAPVENIVSPQSEYDNVGQEQQLWGYSSEAKCIEVVLGPGSSESELEFLQMESLVDDISEQEIVKDGKIKSVIENSQFCVPKRRIPQSSPVLNHRKDNSDNSSPEQKLQERVAPTPPPRNVKPSSAPSSRPTSSMSTSDRPLLALFFEKLLESQTAEKMSKSDDALDDRKREEPRTQSENDLLAEIKNKPKDNYSSDDQWENRTSLDSLPRSETSSIGRSSKGKHSMELGVSSVIMSEARHCVSENELTEIPNGGQLSPPSSNASAPPRARPRSKRPALLRSNAVVSSSEEDEEMANRALSVVIPHGFRAMPPRGIFVRRASDSMLTGKKMDVEMVRKYSADHLRETGYSGDSEDDEVRPTLTDKERCLVRRNSSLNTQLSRLQIHCKSLCSENDNLKNKMEVEMERPLEIRDKDRQRQREVHVLKRKNTELATITRKLEEKVKNLEKKTKESPATERRNLILARQREKEALYENQLRERDKEIQRLKVRMKELVRKLTGKNGEITRAQSTLELEQIIRTVTKERLQLERHLAAASEGLCRGGSGEGEAKRLAALENTNATLRQQLEDLEILTRQHHTLQRHVQEKDLECVTLKEKLKLKNELCQDLECQLARVIEKNTELTIQNSDLQKQIQELQHVSEECKTLKHTLNQVESDWSTAKVQVGSLQGKVGNLESVLRQMKEAADKRRELERQHAEALAQLREQQAAIADSSSKTNQKDRKASVEVTEALQSKIRELEKKAEVQNLRHEELLLEMQSLKKAQGSPKNSWSRSGSLSADLQSPDSGDVTPGLTSLNSLSSGIYTNTTSSSLVAPGSVGLTTGSSTYPTSGTVENTSSEIDRIMAKIEQDNKILAELDKSRSTIDKNLVNGNIPGVMMPPFETDNRILDVLEIPGKGRCHVYIARYSYDPFHHSPNENPEAELAVNAGDYVLVWGTMDEDGFFDGELLDGRRGLVPSNFVDKLVGEDLIEFHQSVVMGLRDGDESMSTSVPQDLDFISQDESQMMIDLGVNQIRHNAYSSYIDLEDIIEEEEETLGEHVPPPVQLTLERQLNKSILIGWNPPPEAPPGSIESYHVYVNGLLKTTVRATERTRALVEGVDSTKLHRISVRSVTPNRRTSRDAACTMVIGKDSPLGPTSVKATSITSTSAVISWLPSNSNFQHTVCVNNVEVRTVKPGVYRHTITGLSPNTTYRVTIRAKNLRAPQFDEKASKNQERLSTTIEFRTLPKDPKGLPDPPVDVQVEAGPQDGSLLVTWLPVTLNSTAGTSNGAPVTGYAVYADGKKVTEVESPTGDHALIDLTKIPGFEPKQVTVRTKSRDSVSADSVPSQIPNHFARGRGRGKFQDDDEIMQSDMDRPSELSDIAEESETELSDEDMHADGHKPGPHHGLPGPHGPHGPQGGHHTTGPAGLRDRLLGRRGAPAPGVITDHLGQTILDHDDNLSDKEIYPGQQQGQQGPNASIPAIGKGVTRARQITKDSASEGHGAMEVYGEEDYEHGPGGRGRFDPRVPTPRSHMERGRPPPPPHHNRPLPRDVRDPRDARDLRDPHYRDGRDPRDLPRDRRDPHMREPHNPRDPREMRDRYDPDGRHREYGRDYPGVREGRGRGGGGVGGPGDQHTRIFVALFDYDPSTMSPNPEACEEELPFREGQLIKVYGDKDPDGFYWGEAGGLRGYVPCNMVSEVQVDDDRVAQELLKESDTGRRRRDGSVGRRGHQADRWGDIYANMPVRKMIAMYDYDPQELSPNVDSEVELSFQTGDIIYVYGDMDDDGFYMGELRGQRGLVPSNFLQDAPPDYSDDHRSRRDTLDPRDRGGPLGQTARGTGPGAHGPPPPPRPDQRDRRKGYEGGPGGLPPRPRQHQRGGERW